MNLPYRSYHDWYEAAYGPAIVEAKTVGRLRTTLMSVTHDAGDWSDAPVPEIVIAQASSRSFRATVDLGSGRFAACYRRGDFIVAPPEAATSIVVEDPHAIRLICIPFAPLLDLSGPESQLPADGNFGRLHATKTRDRELDMLNDTLWREAVAGAPHGPLLADALLLQVAATLLRLRQTRAKPPVGGLAPWQERRCCEYLRAHLAENVSLAALAGIANLSPFHFARMFKQATGLPPHAYQRRLRCEKAQELLLATDLSIGDIAAAVGYETPQAFARMFRAETGAAPSDWRREKRA